MVGKIASFSTLSASIEKAISLSDLGLTPQDDGHTIYIKIPDLTQERRKELEKALKGMAEEAKVAIRNIRRDALDKYRAHLKKKEITEDMMEEVELAMQKMTDKYILEIDKVAAEKDKDLMEI